MPTLLESDKELAMAWIKQEQQFGFSPGMYFIGPTIYSSLVSFPLAHLRLGDEKAILTTCRPSLPSQALSEHMACIRDVTIPMLQEPHHYAGMCVPDVTAETKEEHLANCGEYIRNIHDLIKKSKTSEHPRFYLELIEDELYFAGYYNAYFDLGIVDLFFRHRKSGN